MAIGTHVAKVLAARAAEEQTVSNETPVATSDMQRMLSILEQQALNQAVQHERTAPKENPNYVTNSIFLQANGDPWAKTLKCDIYLGPHLLNKTPLTKAEADVLNTLGPVANGRLTRLDGVVQPATVIPRTDAAGKVERLTIMTDMKKDTNANLMLPSIVSLAQELAAQAMVAA